MYHLGVFDDEVEAAKTRDRKAWGLHGEFAYLSFPEDFSPKGRCKAAAGHKAAPTRRRRSGR